MGFGSRLVHAWNAFTGADSLTSGARDYGPSYGTRPDRNRIRYGQDKSIIASVYTRLSIDFAAVAMSHVNLDPNGDYLSDRTSGLQRCLTIEANTDQAASALRQDLAFTVFEKGVAAVVPVDTTIDPANTAGWDILTMRVGEILQWYPKHVRVNLYNEVTGVKEQIVVEKANVAIVENPLYSVMNEPNSTFQRLIRKLNLLDAVDEQAASGKLDLIIQLPYVVKSESRRQQADQRRKDIEAQLSGSKYGIAYTDGTERITQLNRPAENNLMDAVNYLTTMFYGQIGMTEDVMNGTASPDVMLAYYNRTIEPLCRSVKEEFVRKFLSKTAQTQGQSIMYWRDVFKLISIDKIADIADKFRRNEIATPNDVRTKMVGWKPSKDPKADQLQNSNMPAAPPAPSDAGSLSQPTEEGDSQNAS